MSAERVNRIRWQMEKRRIDAFLLTNLENIRYASGFTGSTATAVITGDRAVILIDSRYTLQAKKECTGFEPQLYSGEVFKPATELINESGPARVGFEAEYVTYSQHRKLRRMIARPARFVGVRGAVEELRMVKDAGEIKTMRQAAALADECFSHLLGFIRPGITERDIALEIYTFFYRRGAMQAFASIIAAGPDAAFPHFKPADRVLESGQMVKMDFGANVGGYNSDITRTIFLGEPDEKQREVYGVVLGAQLAAIAAIRPGKIGREIDSIGRDYIKDKGYGDYFGHGLGHSLGIGVHDGLGFSPTSGTVLAPGMVLTVEPGIYIEGWGGVRIEDDVLVTEDGCEILTKSRKEITAIK